MIDWATPLSNQVPYVVSGVAELCVVILQPTLPPTAVQVVLVPQLLVVPLLQCAAGQFVVAAFSSCGKRARPKFASSVPTWASAARIAFFMLKMRLVWPFALLLHSGEPSFAWL